MLWLRKSVFYIFAILYLIICPLIVARMLGFVFNPLTHRFVKTGLIYVSTNPPDAAVYIDGSLAHQKTPTILRDLTPGEHFIRLELNGYADWERKIPILAKKATVLANTLLIPEEWPIERLSNKPYQDIILVDDDILVGRNPVLKNIDVIQEGSIETYPLFSEKSIYANGQLVRLFSAPKSPYILIEAAIKDKHKFLWINLKENPPRLEDISDLFTETPKRIAWDDSNNDEIYAFYDQNIYRINVKDKAIYPEAPDHLPQALSPQQAHSPQEFLVNDKNDLLIKEGKWIRLYPKEEFDAPQVYDIAKSRPMTNMYFEEKNGELFYLDDNTGALFSAQILPYHPILNIPIPDALRTKVGKNEI